MEFFDTIKCRKSIRTFTDEPVSRKEQEDETFGTSEQTIAVRNMKEAALFQSDKIQIERGWHQSRPVQEAADEILGDMAKTLPEYFPGKDGEVRECISFQREKVTGPSNRYAEQIRERFHNGYVKKSIRLAKEYAEKFEV